MRVIEARGRPADYDPAKDPIRVEPHAPKERPAGHAWDRGGRSLFSSDMHKTETIDYAVCIEGQRVLVLDDTEVVLELGDVVVQVGAWHQWKQPLRAAWCSTCSRRSSWTGPPVSRRATIR